MSCESKEHDLWEVSCKAVLFNRDKSKVLVYIYDGERYVGMPGGHLKYNEGLDEACRREILEELGVGYDGEFWQIGAVKTEWVEDDGTRRYKIVLLFGGILDEETKLRIESGNPEGIVRQEWVLVKDLLGGRYNLRQEIKDLIEEEEMQR